MDRRTFLRRTTATTAVVWVAPAIRSLAAPAFAAEGTPPLEEEGTECLGHAFDLRLDAAGNVSGFVGPLIATDPGVFPDEETASVLNLSLPAGNDPAASATTLKATNSGDHDEGCETKITYENLAIDLRNVDPLLDVQVDALAVETVATHACGGTAATEVTLVDATATVAGTPHTISNMPSSNTTLLNVSQTIGTVSLSVKVVLHQQASAGLGDDGGLFANAIFVDASAKDTATGATQSAIVKVAHAEIGVKDCPAP